MENNICPKYDKPKKDVCPLNTHLDRDCIECDLLRKEIKAVMKIEMPELKRCPFCGGKAYLFVDSGVRVYCSCCNAQTQTLCDMRSGNNIPSGSAVERVITLWNRRTEMEI